MSRPTAADALEARIEAIQEARAERVPSPRELDGRAANEASRTTEVQR